MLDATRGETVGHRARSAPDRVPWRRTLAGGVSDRVGKLTVELADRSEAKKVPTRQVMGSDDRLRVDVLGPIRARDPDGRDVTPDGRAAASAAGAAGAAPGPRRVGGRGDRRAVAGEPPRDPVAALHNHLFRLRRGLPDGVIESTGDGYRLEPSTIDLDADRLAAALSAGDARRSRPRWRRSTTSSSGGRARRTRSSTTSTTGGPRRSAWTSCGSERGRCGRAPAGRGRHRRAGRRAGRAGRRASRCASGRVRC